MPAYSLSNIFVLSMPASQKIHPRWLLILFLVLLQLNPPSFFFLSFFFCDSQADTLWKRFPSADPTPVACQLLAAFHVTRSLYFLTFLFSVVSLSYISFLLQLNKDRKSLLLLDGWHSQVAQKVLGMNLLLPSKTTGACTQTCLLKFKYKDSLALYVLT